MVLVTKPISVSVPNDGFDPIEVENMSAHMQHDTNVRHLYGPRITDMPRKMGKKTVPSLKMFTSKNLVGGPPRLV